VGECIGAQPPPIRLGHAEPLCSPGSQDFAVWQISTQTRIFATQRLLTQGKGTR
jgi:hypothetical protein